MSRAPSFLPAHEGTHPSADGGDAGNVSWPKGGVRKAISFLQKPLTPFGLVQKVRETLDSDARSAGKP